MDDYDSCLDAGLALAGAHQTGSDSTCSTLLHARSEVFMIALCDLKLCEHLARLIK